MMFPKKIAMKYYIIHVDCHEEIKIQEAGGVYLSLTIRKKINIAC